MDYNEHLQWCKDRAMEYAKRGDLTGAIGSMTSDMRKHPETKDHPALGIMAMLMFAGNLNTQREVEDFILGFN